MNRLNLLLLYICFFFISLAQNKEVSGIVLSSETNLPIEFINVGVVNSTVGTITDSQGTFKLSIPKEFLDNEIKIKSIEYETKTFKISQLTQIENKIYLNPVYHKIDEIIIQNDKNISFKELGSKSTSEKLVTGWSYGPSKGGERGILINPKKKKFIIKDVSFHVAQNDFKKINVRLHIRKISNLNQEILTEDIIIPVDIKNGWIKESISSYNIKIDEPVVVSLEWLDYYGCSVNCNFYISLNYFSGTLYAKEASEGNWSIKKGMSPSILLNLIELKDGK